MAVSPQQLRRSQSETERSKNPRYKHPARPQSFRLDKKIKSENQMGNAIDKYAKANARAIAAQTDGGEGDGSGNAWSKTMQWAANLLSPTSPTPKSSFDQANAAHHLDANHSNRYSFVAGGRGVGAGEGGSKGGGGVEGAAMIMSGNANGSRPSPYAIVCLGVAGLDMLAYVDRFPAPDEKVRTTRAVTAGGGNVSFKGQREKKAACNSSIPSVMALYAQPLIALPTCWTLLHAVRID